MSEDVIVALGSNVGNRYQNLVDAKTFLTQLSSKKVLSSSIYESEPIGPSDRRYFNAVIIMHTDVDPFVLLRKFKEYESNCGRDL
ncbi:MAG TPA: 2-amino-4-hydroxy-6-hydroxymethyldihydropteridine diphosphokinase, partial [Balneolales bacterium]|nr:2-amino-4-hydroxy-6-hydroxymethyldihydropteridine diphosphokinase [Balneolales bacterium]